MYKKILSIFFSIIIFLSFPLSVIASDTEHGGSSGTIQNWVPLDEEILNGLYACILQLGVLVDPNISLPDMWVNSSTAGWALRVNPETGVVECDSSVILRDDDKIVFPSEFIDKFKQMVMDYPQTKTGLSTQKEYAISEQVGIFKLKGYVQTEQKPYYLYDYFFNANIDTKYYKVFGVFVSYPEYGYDSLQIWTYSIDNKGLYSMSYPCEEYCYDNRDSSYKYKKSTNASGLAYTINYSLNIPVFSSKEEGHKWAMGDSVSSMTPTHLTNYYLSSKFNQSVDNSVTITNDMLTQNYQEINNNYYNNVYNYVTNYNTENETSIDTSTLQSKIDEMQSSLDQILEELQKPSGGGSGEGGSSSGDSTQDYSKDLEEIKTSLSDIYKKLEEFYEKYKNTVDSETEIDLSNIEKSLSDMDKLLTDFSQDNLQALQDMYKRLDDILTELKNAPDQVDYSTNFDNLEQILADIQLLLTSDSELYHSSLSHIEELLEENNKQNKNFFDKVLDKFDDIITYLKKIYRVNVVDTIADIVSAITDLFDFASLAQRSSETANLMKTKFPFCMPFDLFTTLGVLSAPAVIPHFDLPFNFNIFGTQTENIISIDLTQYEKLARFSRDAFTVLFVVGLIMLTIKVFHGGDDDD